MLDAFYRKPTDDTPEIILDKEKNVFKISGSSYSDNPFDVFDPVFSWFEKYFSNPNPETVLEFKLSYINTSSSKQISDIIALMGKHQDKNVNIKWHYDKSDEDMLYEGETLQSTHKIKIQLISY